MQWKLLCITTYPLNGLLLRSALFPALSLVPRLCPSFLVFPPSALFFLPSSTLLASCIYANNLAADPKRCICRVAIRDSVRDCLHRCRCLLPCWCCCCCCCCCWCCFCFCGCGLACCFSERVCSCCCALVLWPSAACWGAAAPFYPSG